MRKIIILGALLFLAALQGCTNRVTDFTIISSKNVDLSEIGKYQRGSVRVEGEDVAHIIIFIPTGIPNLKEAIDRGIEAVPGAVALVDGVVYMTNFYIPFIYGQNKYTVEGTPLIKPSNLSKLPSKNIVVSYNQENDSYETTYMGDAEFNALKKKLDSSKES
jgi:hypothetical protein